MAEFGDVIQSIVSAAQEFGLQARTLLGIASIESSLNPTSNQNNKRTQYKGLFQMGRDEWKKFGQGNIYNAKDNARAAAKMLASHKNEFQQRFGRAPSDKELYMIHQQGMGFYTQGKMTNIGGNTPKGMSRAKTPQQFENMWGNILQQREARFDKTLGGQPGLAYNAAPTSNSDRAFAGAERGGMSASDAVAALGPQEKAYLAGGTATAENIPAAAARPAASATAPAKRGTVVFAHGMESRYGKTTPAQVEASMKKYADSRGMDFKAISISGDKRGAQLKAIQSYPFKKGDVAVGFSAGGYNVAKAKLPAGVEKVVTGAPGAAGNKDYGGSHMQLPERLAAATAAATPKQQIAQAASAKAQTVQQVIDKHRNDSRFSQLAQYESMIPDRNMPADQWVKQHGDILNNPMVPESARQVIQAAAKPAPAAPTVLREDKIAPTAQQVSRSQQTTPLTSQQVAANAQREFSDTGKTSPVFNMPGAVPQAQSSVAPPLPQQRPPGLGDRPALTPQESAHVSDATPRIQQGQQAALPPVDAGMSAPQPLQARPPSQFAGPTGPGATPTAPPSVDIARDTPGYNEEYGIHPPEPGPRNDVPLDQMQGAAGVSNATASAPPQPDMGSKVLDFLGGGPQQAGTSTSMPQATASPLQPAAPQPQQPAAPPSSTPLATQPGQSNYAPQVTQFAKPPQGFYGEPSLWEKLQGTQTTASQGYGGGSPTQQGGTQTQPLATAPPQPSAASPAPSPLPQPAAAGTPAPGLSTMTGGGFPMQMPQPGGGAQPTGMAPPQPGLSAGTPAPPAPAPMPMPSMGGGGMGGGGGGMGAPDMGAGAMGGEGGGMGGGMGGGGGGMGGGFGKALGGAASAMQKMIPKPNVTINKPISPGAGAPDFSQRILQFLQQGQQQFQPQQQDQAT